jgi:hypothetical protein
MASPVRIEAGPRETPLTASVSLHVFRIETTLAVSRLACGLALAIPIAVRYESTSGTKTRPVFDRILLMRAAVVSGIVILLGSQIANRKRVRDDERI